MRARGAATWRWVSAALATISLMDLGCLLGWVELPQLLLPTGSLAFSCCPQPWALQCRRIVALSFWYADFSAVLGAFMQPPMTWDRPRVSQGRTLLRKVDPW